MKSLLSLALLAALASAAMAQSYLASGELTDSDPTFNRPFSFTGLTTVGTAVPYDVFPFSVSAAGEYVAEGNYPAFDGYLFVYRDAFDPASPLTNLIAGDDDYASTYTVLPGSSGSTSAGSRIALAEASNYGGAATGLNLTPGTTYLAVVTAFNNAGRGAYTLGIGGGPGAVTGANPVPEPASMAALALGAAALLRRRRKA